jgi:site-specific recombinase XerD
MSAQTQISVRVDLDFYLQQLQVQDITPATYRLRLAQISKFHTWLEDKEPTAQLGQLFLAGLREKGYQRNTLRSYYHALRPYFAYLDIPLKVKLKKERRLPRYHSREDFARILQVVSDRDDKWARLKVRDRLIFRTLAMSGLRRSELLSLKCRDVKEGYLFVYRGKGDKDRVAPIPTRLSNELHAYIHTQGLELSDRLFPIGKSTLDQMVKRYALKAGIDDLTPHGLRHYFATRLLELGTDLRTLQELLSHADIGTTAVYLDVLPQHLRRAVELLEDD